MDRTALITGITGQDGSYLADLLLEKRYAWMLKEAPERGLRICIDEQGKDAGDGPEICYRVDA